jgi:hypothetical protein
MKHGNYNGRTKGNRMGGDWTSFGLGFGGGMYKRVKRKVGRTEACRTVAERDSNSQLL